MRGIKNLKDKLKRQSVALIPKKAPPDWLGFKIRRWYNDGRKATTSAKRIPCSAPTLRRSENLSAG
jgi:hypothetical protein